MNHATSIYGGRGIWAGCGVATTAALLGVLVMASAALGQAASQARLAQVFTDNMVLQREASVPVWGWGEPGAAVEVSFGGQQKQGKADATGNWRVNLDAMPASGEGRELRARVGAVELKCANVVVGEVWLATGQSNMVAGGPDVDTGYYPHHQSPGAVGDRAPIRFLRYGYGASLTPVRENRPAARGPQAPAWQVWPEQISGDASPYVYFARRLRDGLGVPVGVIAVAVPGTPQTAWMARETLESFAGEGDFKNAYEQFVARSEEGLSKAAQGPRSFAEFAKMQEEWLAKPGTPWPGAEGRLTATLNNYPTVLYNTRIHPVAPYAIRGAIWHQGEAGPGGPYGARLVAMAKQWREVFGQDFHFIWCTLSRTTTQGPPVTPQTGWFYRSANNGEIRKALELFGDDKRAAMVELYDTGNAVTHFGTKAEMGRRMALTALATVHGKDELYTGPRLVESQLAGNKAVLKFSFVGQGLKYQPSFEGISGFVVRGKDGASHWGEVKVVDATTIEVSAAEVTEVASVLYGAASNPHETLFGSTGLVASPFAVNPNSRLSTYKQSGPELVTLEGQGGNLHVAHVRREGYVFQVVSERSPAGSRKATALVSKEWAAVEVELDGKPVKYEEVTKDGRKYVVLEAPVVGVAAGGRVVVAEKGKAAGLRGVNRY